MPGLFLRSLRGISNRGDDGRMKPYEKYASVYDRSGQILYSLRLIPYLDSILMRHGFIGNSALDIACGTGTLALAYAKKDWRTYGIDSSGAMIKQAEEKAQQEGLFVDFHQQDMRTFQIPHQVDLATCFNDSLNYLDSFTDLQMAIAAVGNALRHGGMFIFDFLTPKMLKENWRDETAFFDDEDLALVLRTLYDGKADRTLLTVTGFLKKGELYERFVERHPLYGFSFLEMTSALESAGFRVDATYKFFTELESSTEDEKLLWIARKL